MSKYRDDAIEKLAHFLFKLVDYETPYDRWDKVNQKPYTVIAQNFLNENLEFAIVDRNSKGTIIGETVQETKVARKAMELLKENDWVKEIKE